MVIQPPKVAGCKIKPARMKEKCSMHKLMQKARDLSFGAAHNMTFCKLVLLQKCVFEELKGPTTVRQPVEGCFRGF